MCKVCWYPHNLYYYLKESVYHGTVISALAIDFTMIGKSLIRMNPPSLGKFDFEGGRALINALDFSGSNFLFSSLSKESIDKERKRHNKAIEDMQRAQKRQERLDYINNEIMKKHMAEKRFMDLNSEIQQYFLVTGRQLEPLSPKPVLSDFYVPSGDHRNCELTFKTLWNRSFFYGIMRCK